MRCMKNSILLLSFIPFTIFASAQDPAVSFRDNPRIRQIITGFEKKLGHRTTADTTVVKYVPEIKQVRQDGKDAGSDITLRELADHTSGLSREPANLENAATGAVEEWENKVLSSIPSTTLHSPIGKSYSYSNIGYAILGLALSRAAHKPFMDMVKEMVFQPHAIIGIARLRPTAQKRLNNSLPEGGIKFQTEEFLPP